MAGKLKAFETRHTPRRHPKRSLEALNLPIGVTKPTHPACKRLDSFPSFFHEPLKLKNGIADTQTNGRSNKTTAVRLAGRWTTGH